MNLIKKKKSVEPVLGILLWMDPYCAESTAYMLPALLESFHHVRPLEEMESFDIMASISFNSRSLDSLLNITLLVNEKGKQDYKSMPTFKLLFNSAFSKQLCFLMPRFLALFPPFKLFLTFKETTKLTKKITDFLEWPVLTLTSIQHVCTALWGCHMENQTSKESRNGVNLLWEGNDLCGREGGGGGREGEKKEKKEKEEKEKRRRPCMFLV